jgi:ribose transport system ATP-binding protein
VTTSTDSAAVTTAAGARSAAAPSSPPLLEVRELAKHYGGIQALRGPSLTVDAGSVHALVGANGAGKSTLVKILAGVEHADSGTVLVDGEQVDIRTPQESTRLGLNFIHQELNLVPKFSVAQNMALGYEGGSRRGMLDRRAARARAREVLAQLGADVDLDVEVARLSVNDRWMVSLGRSLMRDARLIAMDEPTASFTEDEAERLFGVVEGLTASGVAIIYISHRLDEVLRLADDVTVLRNGGLVGTYPAGDLDRAQLTHHIVGHEVHAPEAGAGPPRDAQCVLSVSSLAAAPRVRDVSLDVQRGEILGIAGLVGAGRTELARLLFGADKATAGTMELDGKPYHPKSPYDAIRQGVALIPEERRSQGLLLLESVAFNVSLATEDRNRWRPGLPFTSPKKGRARAADMVQRFGIKTPSVRQRVSELSGGNQQKVVVSKYVATGPRLLILDEPTVGVDVGAREELYAIIRALAETGTAVIVISSDFEELAMCHRVAVMQEGRITDMVDGPQATKERLTALCYATGEAR